MYPPPSRLALLAAFAVVYVVWGSTYLAIRIAVADLPPALLAGVRFVLAGVALGGVALLRGQAPPADRREWLVCGVMGVLLVVLGNGLVTWAEQWVASNQAALIVASSALWTAWFGTFGRRAVALNSGSVFGLVAGLAGTALLVWPQADAAAVRGDGLLWPKVAILLAALAWSWGVIYGRNASLTLRPLMFAACQMAIGGALLVIVGLAAGEAARWQWTLAGIGGMLYLTVFGSCLAYATYMWLIHRATPSQLGTIAYVNPAIATVLGWWLLDEVLSPLQIAGMAVILASVVAMSVSGRGGRRRRPASVAVAHDHELVAPAVADERRAEPAEDAHEQGAEQGAPEAAEHEAIEEQRHQAEHRGIHDEQEQAQRDDGQRQRQQDHDRAHDRIHDPEDEGGAEHGAGAGDGHARDDARGEPQGHGGNQQSNQ